MYSFVSGKILDFVYYKTSRIKDEA